MKKWEALEESRRAGAVPLVAPAQQQPQAFFPANIPQAFFHPPSQQQWWSFLEQQQQPQAFIPVNIPQAFFHPPSQQQWWYFLEQLAGPPKQERNKPDSTNKKKDDSLHQHSDSIDAASEKIMNSDKHEQRNSGDKKRRAIEDRAEGLPANETKRSARAESDSKKDGSSEKVIVIDFSGNNDAMQVVAPPPARATQQRVPAMAAPDQARLSDAKQPAVEQQQPPQPFYPAIIQQANNHPQSRQNQSFSVQQAGPFDALYYQQPPSQASFAGGPMPGSSVQGQSAEAVELRRNYHFEMTQRHNYHLFLLEEQNRLLRLQLAGANSSNVLPHQGAQTDTDATNNNPQKLTLYLMNNKNSTFSGT